MFTCACIHLCDPKVEALAQPAHPRQCCSAICRMDEAIDSDDDWPLHFFSPPATSTNSPRDGGFTGFQKFW